MSNIIRSTEQSGTKIIGLRKVETRRPFEAQAESDIEQYGVRLKEEVSGLEQQLDTLRKQLAEEQQQAHAQLAEWREIQQQQALEQAEQQAQAAAEAGFQEG
ncbi:hypothetical protein RLK93_07575, partial [Streptococcus pneumoniae]|nr:hypothetical protein [Streptococcus pneumoniae]